MIHPSASALTAASSPATSSADAAVVAAPTSPTPATALLSESITGSRITSTTSAPATGAAPPSRASTATTTGMTPHHLLGDRAAIGSRLDYINLSKD
ncbi:MAG: hypothetical protein F6Q13_16085 [Mycobacterium sp.]|nr:MAG: hypothetical protein F6Q13_16085 [Mycobacterium sp.]